MGNVVDTSIVAVSQIARPKVGFRFRFATKRAKMVLKKVIGDIFLLVRDRQVLFLCNHHGFFCGTMLWLMR
jgi:hypothetical protein